MTQTEEKHMNKEDFISIKKEFYKFKEELSESIKKCYTSTSLEEFYLIEGSCIKELEGSFNGYNKLERENKIDEIENFADFLPDFKFINDFSSVINYLKSDLNNDKIFKLISKNIFEYIYDEEYLKKQKCIKYYSRENKLLIEYKDEIENKLILINDPLNEYEITKRIYIISNKPEKNRYSVYKLLEKNSFNNESEEKFSNITIIPYEIYYNILKLFTYLLFYEKDLSKNKTEIFKDNEDYYLIDNEWLTKFKKYYEYESFNIKVLGKDVKVEYNNIEQYFNYDISISKKNILDYYKINLFDEIIDTTKIKSKEISLNNIDYYLNSYIITSKIMDIIKSIFKNIEIDIPKQKILFRNNNIYLINPKKIIVGNLNTNYAFNSNYIFSYSSPEIFELEKEKLFNASIEEYIKSINCDINKSELQSIMKNNKKLGEFLIIQNDKEIKNQSNQYKIMRNKNINNEQAKSGIKISNKINKPKNNNNIIKIYNEKKDNLKANNTSIKTDYHDNNNKLEKSNKDEKNINEQLNQNKEELNEKNERLLKSENECKILKTEFSKIENKLKDKDIELINQSNINELNKKKLEEKEKEIKEFKEKMEQFSLDNNNKEENIKKLNSDIEEKVKLINNLENSKKELEENSKKVNEEIKKLKDKKEKQNNKVVELVKENKKLKEENKDKLEKINLYNGLKKENDELKKNEIEYQKKIQENEKKLKDMNNKEETIKKLNKEIELEKEKNNINNEIKQKIIMEKNNLNKRIKELEENKNEYEQKLENKNKEYQELEKNSDEILRKKNGEIEELKNKYEKKNSKLFDEINTIFQEL